ncbi:hypothetical protein PoB_005273000 [Plakobranchus ocellatus]|uniref:Uncharacterized protein n=1 Tax=Plakobranchus ocellatus TaxID=259542 RepID=A0AAV4C3M4_9GAST|nr:hypothetical protein PoB_005273000 [Plakobranchus ocellatus]
MLKTSAFVKDVSVHDMSLPKVTQNLPEAVQMGRVECVPLAVVEGPSFTAVHLHAKLAVFVFMLRAVYGQNRMVLDPLCCASHHCFCSANLLLLISVL